MRWLLVLLAWLGAAALLAPVCFFAVIVLAGPHSSLLPGFFQPAVLVLGWLVFLVAPIFAARAVWRRAGRVAPGGREPDGGRMSR